MAPVGIERSDQRADDLDPRPVCRCAIALPASTPQGADSTSLSQPRNLFCERGFADAGFAVNEEQSSAPLGGLVQSVTQLGEFVLAPDENLDPQGCLLLRH